MKNKFTNADEYNKAERVQTLKTRWLMEAQDKIQFSPEEELEIAEWELNRAQQAYFKALKRVEETRNVFDGEAG